MKPENRRLILSLKPLERAGFWKREDTGQLAFIPKPNLFVDGFHVPSEEFWKLVRQSWANLQAGKELSKEEIRALKNSRQLNQYQVE